MLLPTIYAVSAAFKPLDEIYIFPPRLFVRRPTLDNFVQVGVLADTFWVPLSKYVFNTVFISVTATVGHLVLSSMAAYPLAKHSFVGKNLFSNIVKWSLLFTSAAMLIPQYIVMSRLGMINTYWAYILPSVQSALGLYLMMNFMGQIPEAMLEAARIDGAGELRIFWQIAMPNVKPAWLTVMIFSFQTIWNTTGATQMSQLVYDEKIKMVSSLLSQVVAGGTARAGAGSALSLYNKGLYMESEEHWKAILKQDAYYELANIGMGKIRERTGDYAAAMKYYKTGNSRQNYSNAFAARRDEAMRRGFVFLIIGVAAVLLGIVAALTVSERRVINEYNRVLSACSYPFYCLKSPFKGYSLLKETKQGSGICAAVILCVFTAVGIISTQLTAFHYNPDSGRQFNIFAVLAETLGIFLLFVICNWAVSTLADGKGKFGEIIIFTSYALIPLIITEVMLLVSSNVFSLKEQAFYGIIRSVGLIWTAVHIFVSNKEVHEYSGGKALLVLFGSVFGMYLLILIITVAYSMFAQLLSFISMVISEIRA